MLVIVGHGPSVANRSLGSWLDSQTVVRLKGAERPNARDWGTRTDFVCASHPRFLPTNTTAKRWVLSEKDCFEKGTRFGTPLWFWYFAQFAPRIKPSTGLRAIFCAVEFLQPDEIGLIGFDRLFRPDVQTSKWHHPLGKYWWAHDSLAEQRAAFGLGVKITEV